VLACIWPLNFLPRRLHSVVEFMLPHARCPMLQHTCVCAGCACRIGQLSLPAGHNSSITNKHVPLKPCRLGSRVALVSSRLRAALASRHRALALPLVLPLARPPPARRAALVLAALALRSPPLG